VVNKIVGSTIIVLDEPEPSDIIPTDYCSCHVVLFLS
jgi:hypothetical protein